jgi:predicted transcriptional regulator
MRSSISAKDYMSADLVVFDSEMDIHRAIKSLLENRISGAPVVDSQGNLVGVLATKDCFKVAFSTSYHQEWGGRVLEYMSQPVETIDADTDIVEVAEIFLKSRYRRFPVTAKGRLVGQISRYDVLKALDDLW